MFLTSKALIDDGAVLSAHITEYDDSLKYGVVLSQGNGSTYTSSCVVYPDVDLEATKVVVNREAERLARHAGYSIDQFYGFSEWEEDEATVVVSEKNFARTTDCLLWGEVLPVDLTYTGWEGRLWLRYKDEDQLLQSIPTKGSSKGVKTALSRYANEFIKFTIILNELGQMPHRMRDLGGSWFTESKPLGVSK